MLPLVRSNKSKRLMETIARLSTAFFDDRTQEVINGLPRRNMEIEVIGVKPDGKPKRRLIGRAGEIIVS